MADTLVIAQVALSGLSILFSIIVLGCISDKLVIEISGKTFCLYKNNDISEDEPATCHTGYSIGSMGLTLSLFYTAIAVAEMLGVKHVAIIGGRTSLYVRGGLAGIMTFAWLVCFGVVVAGYNNNSVASRNLNGSKSAAQSVSAFSFFSIGSWGILTMILVYFRGVKEFGNPSTTPAATSFAGAAETPA